MYMWYTIQSYIMHPIYIFTQWSMFVYINFIYTHACIKACHAKIYEHILYVVIKKLLLLTLFSCRAWKIHMK